MLDRLKFLVWHNVLARDSNIDWDKAQEIIKSEKVNSITLGNINKILNIDWAELEKFINKKLPEASISFSQSGEDMVLKKFFSDKKTGTFVDVGAHHPIKFSNTYYFYLKGWRGINIDPIPGVMDKFNCIRPEDINLELAIGFPGRATFYIFEEGCYNTFDQKAAQYIQENKISNIISQIDIDKISLGEVLKRHLKEDSTIDFLTIDAEGLDEEILKSNDWAMFKPEMICTETYSRDESREITSLDILNQQGYELVGKTQFSSIYRIKK